MHPLATKPRVLCVDDEPHILSALKRLLRQEAYDLVITSDPLEAVALVAQGPPFAVVISDQRMPVMDGATLLTKTRELSPQTVRILLTGYSDIADAVRAIHEGAIYRYLTKPWDDDELKLIVRQCVDQYEILQENRQLEALTQYQNVELNEINQTLEQQVVRRTEAISALNAELKDSFMGAIQAMARMADLHSSKVGHHAKRVATLSYALGKQLHLTEEELSQLVIAATLHDVGKVSIPAKVLTKLEHHLSSDELALVREHPVVGQEIVRLMPNREEEARIIRHHHERMDGNGYPDGLQGEEIPLASRIIAVVDAYDKLLNTEDTTDPRSVENVLHTLSSRMSGMLDPRVLATLMQHLLDKELPCVDEIRIQPGQLRQGLQLSRDLVTISGEVLLGANSEIKPEQIRLLQKFLAQDPPREAIFVVRPTEPIPGLRA